MQLKFLAEEPALLFGKNLVIADLHLGVECEAGVYSVAMKRLENAQKKIIELIHKTRARKLILLGDIKHLLPIKDKLWFERKIAQKVPDILARVRDETEVEILAVKGNHDGGLNINMQKELLINKTIFTHGHLWPSRESVKNCEQIICGHAHPCWLFSDSFRHLSLEKVFVLGFATKKFFEKYRLKPRKFRMVVLPTFNDSIYGTTISGKEMVGPILRNRNFKISEVYLLNGTRIV